MKLTIHNITNNTVSDETLAIDDSLLNLKLKKDQINIYKRFINTVFKQKQSRSPKAGLNYSIKPAAKNQGCSRQGTTIISGRSKSVKRVTNAVGGTNSKLGTNKTIKFKLNHKFKTYVIGELVKKAILQQPFIVNFNKDDVTIKNLNLFLKHKNLSKVCVVSSNRKTLKNIRNMEQVTLLRLNQPNYLLLQHKYLIFDKPVLEFLIRKYVIKK